MTTRNETKSGFGLEVFYKVYWADGRQESDSMCCADAEHARRHFDDMRLIDGVSEVSAFDASGNCY